MSSVLYRAFQFERTSLVVVIPKVFFQSTMDSKRFSLSQSLYFKGFQGYATTVQHNFFPTNFIYSLLQSTKPFYPIHNPRKSFFSLSSFFKYSHSRNQRNGYISYTLNQIFIQFPTPRIYHNDRKGIYFQQARR